MKKQAKQTKKGRVFTDLMLEVMRVHGFIREHRHRLARPHSLNVARWPVLGAVEKKSLTVSQIARGMGLHRQNVQAVVNSMREQGLVVRSDNPDHAGAPLIEITPKARKLLKALHSDQQVWANGLGAHLSLQEMLDCEETLRKLGDILSHELEHSTMRTEE